MISIVVPVFNEENNVQEVVLRFEKVFEKLQDLNFEIIFVNDGSKDATVQVVKDFCKTKNNIKLVSFTRNFGHQNAVMAGIEVANGDAIVIIDADLQDPPEVVPQLIEKWKEGYDIVYGQRIKRKGETLFKKFTAFLFYRILKYLSNLDIPLDTGDFRLIDKKVKDTLMIMPEKNKFIRGLISWTGYKQIGVPYERDKRFSGKTKYNVIKMLNFAILGITSFSKVPLKLSIWIGFLSSFISFLYFFYVLYLKLFTDRVIQGWTSLIMVILFIGGIQLIILGIIGTYLGFMNDQVKDRPNFIIAEKVNL